MEKGIKKHYHSFRSFLSRSRLSKIKDGSLIILTYHRILPDNHQACLLEQPGMVLSPDNLDMQLRQLLQYASPILIEDWIKKQQEAELDNILYFAVTFDDGWKDNYDYAVPVLKKHNIPATIFLVSKMVNTRQNFWPGRLATLVQTITKSTSPDIQGTKISGLLDINAVINMANISNEYIDQIISHAKQYSDLEIHHMLDNFYIKNPDLREADTIRTILNHEEIISLENMGLINFGSHTQTHQRLSGTLSESTLIKEIIHSKDDLEKLSNKISPIFCYPNGDTSIKAAQLVKENYTGACTTQRGINRPGCNPYKLKRFNLHNGNSGYRERFFSSLLELTWTQ